MRSTTVQSMCNAIQYNLFLGRQRLGHAQTSTTLNIYAHALKSRDEDAANKLDLALNDSHDVIPFPSKASGL